MESPKNHDTLEQLSADPRWAAYSDYLHSVTAIVQREWYHILEGSRSSPPRDTHVTVTFALNAKGETDVRKVEDFGAGKQAVLACLQALQRKQPYPPWTDAMIATLGSEQTLTFTFYYQ